ncbi:unnamed protein product [Mytilus coruscus]|uniref:Uncharacterized protein n=1 Tax=Mytilus coruscus TaxID=42192 RepID=A0A6J8E9W7_MYTCO|nr:unnamed protein product [Mytilus coruscus]
MVAGNDVIPDYVVIIRAKCQSRTRKKAAPQKLVEDVQDLVEEQSQELPPIYRPSVRRRKARQEAPGNLVVRETNTKQSSVPTANDIADALFLKFQSSGVQLVKGNTVVQINDVTGMLSTSSIQPENPSTTDSQGPMLAVFQPPISSDPNINTPSDSELVNSSNSNKENPYETHYTFRLPCQVKVKSDVWCDNYAAAIFAITTLQLSTGAQPSYVYLNIQTNSIVNLTLRQFCENGTILRTDTTCGGVVILSHHYLSAFINGHKETEPR